MIEHEEYPHLAASLIEDAIEFSKIIKIPAHELLGISKENLHEMNTWLDNHFKKINQKIDIPNFEIEEK